MRKLALYDIAFAAVCAATLGLTSSAGAEEADPSGLRGWLDNDYYKISLDLRARIELADFEGLDRSEAYTVRTRLGLGTKPWHGLSAFGELENIVSLADGEYFDVVEPATGQSPIADPEDTELNQLYGRLANAELGNLDLIVGRQRIKLDDDRFIGNVGWRQNEQTYDAARISSTFGMEHATLSYGHIWDVHRIFGDDAAPAALQDFDSDSHFVRLAVDRWEGLELVLFAYLLDFDDSPVNSSSSYGFRVAGTRALDDPWAIAYAASYALQTDAASNPVDYTAQYLAAEGTLAHADAGAFTLGYELLGSDDGVARFVTPLATAHKFNGFADAFGDNGGVQGLQDLYAAYAPQLPGKLNGKLIYHRFWHDDGGKSLGGEIDAVVSYPVSQHITVLSKAAYLDGRSADAVDRWRWWLEATLKL